MLNSPLQKDVLSCVFINPEGFGILSSYLFQCINLCSLAGEKGPEIESRRASGAQSSSRFTELCLRGYRRDRASLGHLSYDPQCVCQVLLVWLEASTERQIPGSLPSPAGVLQGAGLSPEALWGAVCLGIFTF